MAGLALLNQYFVNAVLQKLRWGHQGPYPQILKTSSETANVLFSAARSQSPSA